jgi:uncharacterized membrane protein (DUF106 family)
MQTNNELLNTLYTSLYNSQKTKWEQLEELKQKETSIDEYFDKAKLLGNSEGINECLELITSMKQLNP